MKKIKGTIYLGGTIDGRTFEDVMKQRNKAKKLLNQRGFKVLCPMRGKEALGHRQITRFTIMKNYAYHDNWAFIDRDLMDLQQSDCLLILTGDKPTDGTWLEFSYMLWVLRKPVVMIAPSRIGAHGWSNRYASYIAKDLKDAVEFINKFLFKE